ncbi:MAG: type II toxin-antitoxin system PemK/MazF family toxin [Candidatus Thorarchaeota archaeon]
MNSTNIQSNDIIYFDLDPTKGHETNKVRPCLVTSVPSGHSGAKGPSGIVVVLPITSSQSNFWTEIPVRKKGKMKNVSYVLCHQIRSLDRSRATKKIAVIDLKEMKRVKQVLKIMLTI